MSGTLHHGDDGHSDSSQVMGDGAVHLDDKPAAPFLQEKESIALNDPENELKVGDTGSMSASKEVDAISTETPDSTGSMEVTFDVEYDLEAYLEEFSRLTRKGKFNTAMELFHACPPDLKDHPEFILDFVDTLLKQGAYEKLAEFTVDKEPFLLNLLRDCGIVPIHYLRSMFELGKWHVLGASKSGILKDAGADEVCLELLSNFEKLDSIQLQLLCNLIQLDSEIERFKNSPQDPPRDLKNIMGSHLKWHELYKHLLSTNRIWDMRDLFHALCSKYGVGDTIKLLFKSWRQVTHSKFLNSNDSDLGGWFHFVLDWTQCPHGDESTELALLDLLVTISLQLLSHSSQNEEPIKTIITQAMTHANQFAISLSLGNSENVQTSPYLRWVLANQRLARELPVNLRQIPNYKYLKRPEGVVIWTCNLPIYVPFDFINNLDRVFWKKQSRTTSENLLNLGLSASRKNEDCSLAVHYLEEMFYTSDSPLEILNELSRLQSHGQGDATGYLRTCLTKYLCAADKNTMENLSNELREFDNRNLAPDSTARNIDPISRWCQRVIQSALHHYLGRPLQTHVYLEMKERAYRDLPYDFKRLLAELGKIRDYRDDRFFLGDIDEPLPARFAEPCQGALYRDGNFIICDSSGYFTRIFPATSNEGGAGS